MASSSGYAIPGESPGVPDRSDRLLCDRSFLSPDKLFKYSNCYRTSDIHTIQPTKCFAISVINVTLARLEKSEFYKCTKSKYGSFFKGEEQGK